MRQVLFNLPTGIFAFLLFLITTQNIFGQDRCLSETEAKKAVQLTESSNAFTINSELQKELIEMQAARHDLEMRITQNLEKNQNLIPQANEVSKKSLLRLCEIVKQNGWTRMELVGEDGMEAALSFLGGNQPVELQRQIFPVVAAAVKKGLVKNNYLAGLIDSIRVGSGLTQIFGTQTVIRNDLFYLYPLANDAKVDEWRKLYDLPPLGAFMKYLQLRYGMPVIKSPRFSVPSQLKDETQKAVEETTKNGSPSDLANEEIVKVDSSLVNLNVRISANNFVPTKANNLNAQPENPNLQKDDFELFVDGKKQDISFFSSADTPFDLILLLDLSGSTAGKQDLIRKSTQRFVEAARPSDRIAVVTFTDEAKIISGLTSDKAQLLKRIKKIDDYGGSGVWLALQFVFENIVKKESQGRRSAIVIMTDGVDSSLIRTSSIPASYPNFSDVLEIVRSGETTIVPIYLDTEKDSTYSEKNSYKVARRTLSLLGEESGGQMYTAKKISDLDGIYGQVISDLGRVYSLGYEPSEINRDGAWHTLNVKLPSHPNLSVRTKTGFYAK